MIVGYDVALVVPHEPGAFAHRHGGVRRVAVFIILIGKAAEVRHTRDLRQAAHRRGGLDGYPDVDHRRVDRTVNLLQAFLEIASSQSFGRRPRRRELQPQVRLPRLRLPRALSCVD